MNSPTLEDLARRVTSRDLELALARASGAEAALAAVCAIIVRTGGWLPPDDQRVLRQARALLAEVGR